VKTVTIVNYGAGNLESVRNAVFMAGADFVMAQTPEDILKAERLILPGVGAAGNALENIRRLGLEDALIEAVRSKGIPMLGICLGMQMLAEKLHEFGEHDGFAWIQGEVVHIRTIRGTAGRVPHMGWNRVEVLKDRDGLFSKVGKGREFYFCHSYALRPKSDEVVVGRAEYGEDLVAAVQDRTVFATQFHPEKSQLNGQRLLEAFLNWSP
jgi:glutamine amidotransferase